MNIDASCRAEVDRLHDFFVEWFHDEPADPETDFAAVERVLHADFSMVLPTGQTIDRATSLAQIRSAHGSARGGRRVDIEIHAPTTLASADDAALVSYEERQFAAGVLQNRRTSTAYFVAAPGTPHGVQWSRLHETLIEE